MKTASLLAVLALLLMAVPVSAQFTLTQASFPTTGSHTIGEAVSPATFTVGSAGGGQTWTFSDYEWAHVRREELMDAATTPYAGWFPTSNRCILMTEGDSAAGDVYAYYRMAANGMYFLGTGSTDTVMVPVQEARALPFPCTYQTQWTTVIRYEWEPVPGYLFSMTDSLIRTVDGWGTLTTPYGSQAALRFFSHMWAITRMPLVPPTITETVSYGWYSSQGEELMGVSSQEGVTDSNFSSGYLNMTGVPLAVEPVRGPVAHSFAVGQNYPNPFNPGTMLPVELEKTGRVTLDIYDETGRLVSHGEFELSAGHHDLAINAADWATGAYFARVMSAAQAQTVKMQLVK